MEELVTFITNQPQRPQLFIVAILQSIQYAHVDDVTKMTHFKQNALTFFRSIPRSKYKRQRKTCKNPLKPLSHSSSLVGQKKGKLTDLLTTKGTPVCIKGVEGIGKRFLAEEVIGQNEWIRVPDLHINNYLNADALLGRLAQTFADVGNDALLKGLSGKKRISVVETLNLGVCWIRK